MATLLTLIRHGHTVWNALGRYQGYAPIPLSERGQAQAACLAEVLAGDDTIQAVYSSDLARCRQTAAPLEAVLGLPVHVDERYREMHYGRWQGMTLDEIKAYDAVAYQAYQADPFTVPVPGGDSQKMLQERVVAGLTELLARHAGEHVVLVTHGGPVREILRHFDLWPGGLPLGNASRTVLQISADGVSAVLQLADDVSHLPVELQPEMSGTAFLVPR
ncbi:histidine phosphatase family protein [Chloroflexota bacterium]